MKDCLHGTRLSCVIHVQQLKTLNYISITTYWILYINIIPRLTRTWRSRTDRMMSFQYLTAVMFPWVVTLAVFVCLKRLGRGSVVLTFAIFKKKIIIDNQRGIFFYQIRQLPCLARGARAHNLCSRLPFRMDSFVHGNVVFSR